MAQVSVCPKTYEEIKVASSKLRCKNDSYGNNQYMCIPNSEKTSLVQFCDDGEMGLVEEGNCLEASVGRVILRNCSEFLSGCPNTSYDRNAVYKYPKCQEINTVGRCYIADPSCPPQMTNDLSNIYANVGIAVAVISAIVLVCYCWRELLTLFYRCTTRLRICFKPEIRNDMKEKEPEKVYLTSDQDDQERDTSPCQPNTDPLNDLQRTTDENSSLQGNDISGAEEEGVCRTSDLGEQGGVPSLFQPNTNLSLQKTTNEHSSSQGDFKVTVKEDAQIKFLCPPSNTGLELTMSGNASIQAVCGAADVGNINEGMNLKTDLESKNGEPSVTKDLGNRRKGPSIRKNFGIKREVHKPTKDIGNTGGEPNPHYYGNDEAEKRQQQAMSTTYTSSGYETLHDPKTAATKPMKQNKYDTKCQQ